MSGTKKADDLTTEFLDAFLSTVHDVNEKELVRQIVRRFTDCGLPVKTKQYDQAAMQGTFRILCFIKKSAEAVIINNKGMGRDGMSVQVRINNRSTFDNLDGFNQSVRNQIINAANCGYCSPKCEGKKKYMFTYQDKEYVKCHFLCNNFIFENIDEIDISGIIDIIDNEITYKQTRTKTKTEG